MLVVPCGKEKDEGQGSTSQSEGKLLGLSQCSACKSFTHLEGQGIPFIAGTWKAWILVCKSGSPLMVHMPANMDPKVFPNEKGNSQGLKQHTFKQAMEKSEYKQDALIL